MSLLEIITDPTATQTVAAIGAIRPTGILDVINQQTDAGTVTVKNLISFGVTGLAGYLILKSGFAWGKLLSVAVVGGIVFWLMNGGMTWFGGQVGSQVGASSSIVQVEPHTPASESFLEGHLEL